MSFEIKRARGRTAVFSGTRQCSNQISRLEDLCIQKLLDNVNRIEFLGDVPYYILKPLLTKIPLAQLKRIESYNPGIVEDEDSDEPWKLHCQSQFPDCEPHPNETWRDLFHRCESEHDRKDREKIKKLTKRIKKREQSAAPTRQAQIVNSQLPKGKTNAAPKTVITKTIRNSVNLPGRTGSASAPSTSKSTTVVICRETNGSQSKMKAKTAPLMQKSMQLFKSRYRR